MSTLVSTDMVYSGKSSTRVHNPPGGKTSISFGGDTPTTAPKQTSKPAADTPASNFKQAGSLTSTVPSTTGKALASSPSGDTSGIVVLALPGTPLLSAVLSQLCSEKYTEAGGLLALPYAAHMLIQQQSGVRAVLVVGEVTESYWCSKELLGSTVGTLQSLSISANVPIVIGLNFTAINKGDITAQASRLVSYTAQLASFGVTSASIKDTASNNRSNAFAQLTPYSATNGAPAHDTSSDAFGTAKTTDQTESSTSGSSDASVEGLRAELLKQGTTGAFALASKLKAADTDETKTLTAAQLSKALKDAKVTTISSEAITQICSGFASGRHGQFSYPAMLSAVAGPLPDARRHLVLVAFDVMDVDKSGKLDARDLKTRFDVARHPAVQNGTQSRDELQAEFNSSFDTLNSKVTVFDWLEYYSLVSLSIDDDAYFEKLMRNCWKMSGGAGFSANTACKRVIAVRGDGRATVEEIQDDAVLAQGQEAIIAHLKKSSSGLSDVKSVDVTGVTGLQNTVAASQAANTCSNSTAANTASATCASPSKRQAPGGRSNLQLG